MATNEHILKRLVDLSAHLTDAHLKTEQRDLVFKLATNLDIQIQTDEEERETTTHEEVHEPAHAHAHNHTHQHAHNHHHEEPAHTAASAAHVAETPKAHSTIGVSSARSKFEQPQEDKAKKVERKPHTVRPKSVIVTKRDAGSAGSNGSSSGASSGNECDLSDPKIIEAYDDVRDDNTDSNWMLLGYGTSKKELKLYGSGAGGLDEFVSSLPDGEVTYGYLRITYGDSARSKFVFVTYVPESLSGLAKAKANMHKPSVDKFLKYFHVQVAATTHSDLQEATIQSKLAAAGGANYGTGGAVPAGSENYGNIKHNARSFFHETEKRGSVQISYNKDPLSRETPVSLSGRAGITEKYINLSL